MFPDKNWSLSSLPLGRWHGFNCVASCCCSWWTFLTHCLNTEWTLQLTFISEIFELLMKSCAKFDSLLVTIQCATVYSLEKVNFKV